MLIYHERVRKRKQIVKVKKIERKEFGEIRVEEKMQKSRLGDRIRKNAESRNENAGTKYD